MCFWNKVSRSGDVMIGPLTVRAKVAAYKTPDYYSAGYTTSKAWTIRNSAADNDWVSVCWSPELGLFVAVAVSGVGNRVMTSPDGITWTIRSSAVDNNWVSVCWSPELGLFVAVAYSGTGNRVMTSPDGITWTIRSSAADNSWVSVCWSPERGLFVAVANSGTGNRVMTSPDGITWTIRSSAVDNNWYGICWSPERGLFVAVAYTGTGNRVMTSPDGITWTIRNSAADNSWRGVCWSPERGLFVAVADTGTGNRVMTSPDGITWTIRNSAADNNWRGVCWSPELGLFVAVANSGTGNRVMTSPDGITWTSRNSAADNSWSSVCWSPELGLFVAVSYSGVGNRVMTSPLNDCVRRQGDVMTGNLITQALSATTGAFSDNITMAATKTVDGRDISELVKELFSIAHDDGDLVTLTGLTGWTNLKKYTIPGGTLGNTGSVLILAFCHATGINDTKFCRIRFGGTTLATVSYAASGVGTGWLWGVVHNQGAANHQHWTSFAVEETAIEDTREDIACNVDTASDVDIDVDGSVTNASDTLKIYNFVVLLKRS